MAQQLGPIYITGCYDNVCFYHMNGKYYARSKSSLDRKRVKRDMAFRETMRYARWLERASKIASSIYRGLEKEERKHSLFRTLTGKAMLLLKEGKTEEEVLLALNYFYSSHSVTRDDKTAPIEKDHFAEEILSSVLESSYVFNEEEYLYEPEPVPP